MKIAYYTAGGRDMASSRLRAWMIGDALSEMGHQVTFNEGVHQRLPDVAIFQKRFDLHVVMASYRKWGVQVVWDCDDYIGNGPIQYADSVTVDTPAKLALYPNAVVIPDALDLPGTHPVKDVHRSTLRSVVWVGNAENFYHTAVVSRACRTLGIEFRAITAVSKLSDIEKKGADQLIEWSEEDVDEQIIQADCVVLPYLADGRWSSEWVLAKSANRLLKAWGLGMPVIATPIPAYVEAGLIHQATTEEAWARELETMKAPAHRAEDGQRGMLIAQNYRAEKVAEQWLEVFERCMQPH